VPLAFVANGFEAWRHAQGDTTHTADQIARDAILRTAGSLLDQSFLSGISALVDALGDPERYGSRFVQQLATGFVPFSGALRTVTQATDPYQRVTRSVAEGVRSVIPGQSEQLPPRLTRFGEPVERGAGAFNVFKPSPVVDDPIAAALDAADIHLRPAQGPKLLSLARGVSVPLEPSERQRAGEISGQSVRLVLDAVVASPAYQQGTPAQQQQMLERAIAQGRAAAHDQVRAAVVQRLQAAGQGR
jgi:hypothetical protein